MSLRRDFVVGRGRLHTRGDGDGECGENGDGADGDGADGGNGDGADGGNGDGADGGNGDGADGGNGDGGGRRKRTSTQRNRETEIDSTGRPAAHAARRFATPVEWRYHAPDVSA